MILDGLDKNYVEDDKLWETIGRANKLTTGSYNSWCDNASALVPLMEQILVLSKKKKKWKVYFYAMSRLFWLLRQNKVNDIPRLFKLAEIFHQDKVLCMETEAGSSGRAWQVHVAAAILSLYLEYPQIDDKKIGDILNIFRKLQELYGNQRDNGNYDKIMVLALLNKDTELAEEVKRKLEKVEFKKWCYVCYYGRPMIRYCVIFEDFEGIEEWILRICGRMIPAKYRWCYDSCESAKEEGLVYEALLDSLYAGKHQLFGKIFTKWKMLYEESEEGRKYGTHEMVFHALAGDWSRLEERLREAEKDDKERREKKETPLNGLHWFLCWYCFFRMLDGRGIKTVRMMLGDRTKANETVDEIASGGQVPEEDGRREWTCLDVAGYFEHLADGLGRQMDKARRKFQYGLVKKTYEKCFLGMDNL